MNNILKITRERYLLFDGAMGTSLQKMDISGLDFRGFKRINELLNLYYPEYVRRVHEGFIKAGADIIETNTFSGSAVALKHYGLEEKCYEINSRAVKIAKETAGSFEPGRVFVAGSVGPTDRLPSLGQISFDEMVDGFTPQMEACVESRVDLVLLETFQDPLGIKAGLSALQKTMKKHGFYPLVMVSVTFSENGRMLLGTTPGAILNILEPYDLFSIGINCSLGPRGLRKPLEIFARHHRGCISFMPNAGLPVKREGKLQYDLNAFEYSDIMAEFAHDLGIEILGGCCGTDCEYIRELKNRLGEGKRKSREIKPVSGVSSLYSGFSFRQDPAPFIIGERTNMSGSRKFAEIAERGDLEETALFCGEYSRTGMHAIDLFLRKNDVIDETFVIELVKRLSTMLKVALCFDSKDLDMIKKVLKVYPGRMIINSASLKEGEERLKDYFRTAREYGASIILLAIDENMMAVKCCDKIRIFKRMIGLARQCGLKDSQIILDPLTFSLVSGDSKYDGSASEILEAVSMIKAGYPGIQTLLGISNVSYGVKEGLRRLINSVFLFEAVKNGLDMAILNAGDIMPMNRIDEEKAELVRGLIYNRDNRCGRYLKELLAVSYDYAETMSKGDDTALPEKIKMAVINGNPVNISGDIEKLIKDGYEPRAIITDILIKAIGEVGRLFKDNYIPLPFVLQSAQVMKEAFSAVSRHMPREDTGKGKKIVLATVKGDIHDIGKNLVDIIVSSHGYDVVNLGIEVDIEDIINSIRGGDCCLGLSGLINESLDVMEEYAERLEKEGFDIPLIVGGAAVSRQYVTSVLKKKYHNACYGRDAFDAVKLLKGEYQQETRVSDSDAGLRKTGEKSINRKNADAGHLFNSVGEVKSIDPGLDDIISELDLNRLFKFRWKYRKMDFEPGEPERQLENYLEALKKMNAVTLHANYRYTRVIRRGDSLYIPENGTNVVFQRDGFSFIDYFSQNREDVIIFYAATAGSSAKKLKDSYYGRGEYSDYHRMNGLIDEIMETFLEYLSRHIADEAGFSDISGIEPLRLAYGYPFCPKLKEQAGVYDILEMKRLGISFTEIYQLVPEESSSGFILPFVEHKLD